MKGRTYDRYVSQKILDAVIRPQEADLCVLTSMVTAINSVFGISLTIDDVLDETEWDLDDDVYGDELENDDLVEGLNTICKKLGLKGFAEEYIYKIPSSNTEKQKQWEDLKNGIKDPNCSFIYLDDGYYANIAGYFEEELKSNWLIFAENSEDWDPLWIRDWEEIQEDIEDQYSWGTIIRLKKKNTANEKPIQEPIRKSIKLEDAIDILHKRVQKESRKLKEKRTTKELCTNILIPYEIKGKPDYTAEDFANRYSKYAEKLRLKADKPTK